MYLFIVVAHTTPGEFRVMPQVVNNAVVDLPSSIKRADQNQI
jgi:hypothetical protein